MQCMRTHTSDMNFLQGNPIQTTQNHIHTYIDCPFILTLTPTVSHASCSAWSSAQCLVAVAVQLQLVILFSSDTRVFTPVNMRVCFPTQGTHLSNTTCASKDTQKHGMRVASLQLSICKSPREAKAGAMSGYGGGIGTGIGIGLGIGTGRGQGCGSEWLHSISGEDAPDRRQQQRKSGRFDRQSQRGFECLKHDLYVR